MTPLHPSRALAALAVALGVVALSVGTAGSASAEDGYRYWNYSHLEGDSFAFAQTGPGEHNPKDGDVEGWRYGTSTVSQGIFPRADLDEVSFDSVCGETEAAAGEKRVAVVVDYGTEADAGEDGGTEVPEPRAACAVVPEAASGQQVLDAVADVRGKQAMICAVDGYPASGCGAPVADAQVAADEQPVAFEVPSADEPAEQAATSSSADDSGDNTLLLVGIGVVVLVLLGAGIPLYRRGREA
jgi:hypothetical protein